MLNNESVKLRKMKKKGKQQKNETTKSRNNESLLNKECLKLQNGSETMKVKNSQIRSAMWNSKIAKQGKCDLK